VEHQRHQGLAPSFRERGHGGYGGRVHGEGGHGGHGRR
jgi:hypothetical protein